MNRLKLTYLDGHTMSYDHKDYTTIKTDDYFIRRSSPGAWDRIQRIGGYWAVNDVVSRIQSVEVVNSPDWDRALKFTGHCDWLCDRVGPADPDHYIVKVDFRWPDNVGYFLCNRDTGRVVMHRDGREKTWKKTEVNWVVVNR